MYLYIKSYNDFTLDLSWNRIIIRFHERCCHLTVIIPLQEDSNESSIDTSITEESNNHTHTTTDDSFLRSVADKCSVDPGNFDFKLGWEHIRLLLDSSHRFKDMIDAPSNSTIKESILHIKNGGYRRIVYYKEKEQIHNGNDSQGTSESYSENGRISCAVFKSIAYSIYHIHILIIYQTNYIDLIS